MKIDNPSLEFLHNEHTRWLEEIKFWNNEIRFLKKILSNIIQKNKEESLNTKATKYLNHLEHNSRFLRGITETIHAHESFLKHTSELNLPPVDTDEDDESFIASEEDFEIMTDHDKTRQHLADFRKRYQRLKNKIYSLHEKFNKNS